LFLTPLSDHRQRSVGPVDDGESVENRDRSQPSEALFCHRFAASPPDLGFRPREGFYE